LQIARTAFNGSVADVSSLARHVRITALRDARSGEALVTFSDTDAVNADDVVATSNRRRVLQLDGDASSRSRLDRAVSSIALPVPSLHGARAAAIIAPATTGLSDVEVARSLDGSNSPQLPSSAPGARGLAVNSSSVALLIDTHVVVSMALSTLLGPSSQAVGGHSPAGADLLGAVAVDVSSALSRALGSQVLLEDVMAPVLAFVGAAVGISSATLGVHADAVTVEVAGHSPSPRPEAPLRAPSCSPTPAICTWSARELGCPVTITWAPPSPGGDAAITLVFTFAAPSGEIGRAHV
jgi:hypothetical protein